MDRINCPASECWQRTSSGEERDCDICAMHINATIDYADSIEKRLCRCIDVTNSLPEQQRAYKEMLNWIRRNNGKK